MKTFRSLLHSSLHDTSTGCLEKSLRRFLKDFLVQHPMKIHWILFFIVINVTMMLALPQAKASDFSVKTYDGKIISTHDLKGKVVILVFYQYYCPHCRMEIPKLSAGLSGCNGNYIVLMDGLGGDVAEDYKFFSSYSDEKWFFIPEDFDLARKYDVSGVPTIVIIDTNGNIFKIISGESNESFCDLVIAAGGTKEPSASGAQTPMPTSISLSAEISHPEKVIAKGRLYSETLGVPSRVVIISLAEMETWTLTDPEGKFSTTLDISQLPDGKYVIRARFPGDQNFSASEASKDIQICREKNISVRLSSQLIDLDRNSCFYIASDRDLDNISFIDKYSKFNFSLEKINKSSYKICVTPVEEFFGNLSLRLQVKSGKADENVTVFLFRKPPEEILNKSVWIERKRVLEDIIEKINGMTLCENFSEECLADLLIARKAESLINKMHSDVSSLLDSLQEGNLTGAHAYFTSYLSETRRLRDIVGNATDETLKLNMSRYVNKGEFISFDIPMLSNRIKNLSIYIKQEPSPQLLLGIFGKPEGDALIHIGGLVEKYSLEWDYGYLLFLPHIDVPSKKLHIDINFKSLGSEKWIFIFPLEMKKARIDIAITVNYNNVLLINYIKILFPY
jgi:peroxiredoxin